MPPSTIRQQSPLTFEHQNDTLMDMTGYTKLFGSIVASTIWRETNEVRILWITMLAMANKDGIVEASIPGLADLARISIDECKASLAALESPDEYSRTPDFEGRRIAKVDGGWQVLNHGKYRAKMSVDERREYLRQKQQEQRDKKKLASTGVNKRSDSSTGSTHAEAQSDAESEEEPPPDREEADAVARRPLAISGFEDFWQAYPKKVGKGAAEVAWKKQRVSAKLSEILTAIRAAKSSLEWTKEAGQFVPNPATWLNQRRWEDQLTPSRGSAPSEDVDPAGWREWLKDQKRDYMPYRFAIPPFLKDDFRKSRA